MPTTLSYNH